MRPNQRLAPSRYCCCCQSKSCSKKSIIPFPPNLVFGATRPPPHLLRHRDEFSRVIGSICLWAENFEDLFNCSTARHALELPSTLNLESDCQTRIRRLDPNLPSPLIPAMRDTCV